jgi:hypothetical protein
VLFTEEELLSFALRSITDTDVTDADKPIGATNDCASHVEPCAVRHGPSVEVETKLNCAADTDRVTVGATIARTVASPANAVRTNVRRAIPKNYQMRSMVSPL